MLVKWIYFAILVQFMILCASQHPLFLDLDDFRKLKVKKGSSCVDGKCNIRSKHEKQKPTTVRPTEETTGIINKEEEHLPNINDLIRLLSLITNGNRGETKISFNVRDIQSGFHNSGSKYHIGNDHRESNREKRDTESELNEDATVNEDSETDLALTSEAPTHNAQTTLEEVSSKELATQSATDNPSEISDNKALDVDVRYTKTDNFQDSNVAYINDFARNDSTTSSVNQNEELSEGGLIMDVDNSNVQVATSNFSNVESNHSNNDTVSDAELPTVKISLTRKDLSKIQNALSDDLGVKSKGANPVANFSLDAHINTDNKNPVVVIVYNCSCGNKEKHTHDNQTEYNLVSNNNTTDKNNEVYRSTELNLVGNDNTIDDNEEVNKTRRMLTATEPVLPDSQSKITIPDNATKANNELNNKSNNALLENELLQKCNSLLALQQASKANAGPDTKLNVDEDRLSFSQTNIEASQQLSFGASVDNNNASVDNQADLPQTNIVVEETHLSNRNKRNIAKDAVESLKMRANKLLHRIIEPKPPKNPPVISNFHPPRKFTPKDQINERQKRNINFLSLRNRKRTNTAQDTIESLQLNIRTRVNKPLHRTVDPTKPENQKVKREKQINEPQRRIFKIDVSNRGKRNRRDSATDTIESLKTRVNKLLHCDQEKPKNQLVLTLKTEPKATQENQINEYQRRNVILDLLNRGNRNRRDIAIESLKTTANKALNRVKKPKQKYTQKSQNHKRQRRNIETDRLNKHRNKRNVFNYNYYVNEDDFANNTYSKEGSTKIRGEVKTTRNPKYYDYVNDKMDLLKSDPNSSENDGTIVTLKSFNDDTAIHNDNNNHNSLIDVENESETPFNNTEDDVTSSTRDFLSLLSFRPVYINVYLQLLMKDLEPELPAK